MDTGVLTILHANDTGGSTCLWGDVRRVRTHLRRRMYGHSISNIWAWRSLAINYVANLHLPGLGVRMSGKEASRDGGGDAKTRHGEFLNYFRALRPVGSGYGDMPSHYQHPFSLGWPNVRECGPGLAGRPTL
jgi:hypothetical protein